MYTMMMHIGVLVCRSAMDKYIELHGIELNEAQNKQEVHAHGLRS